MVIKEAHLSPPQLGSIELLQQQHLGAETAADAKEVWHALPSIPITNRVLDLWVPTETLAAHIIGSTSTASGS